MNIYLISQDINGGYDTFDSAIVAASSFEEAKNMLPSFNRGLETIKARSWTSPENVSVELIGIAAEGIEIGNILSSFNAG